MKSANEIRAAVIKAMVETGELIKTGGEFYEDMGGHALHESNLDYHIDDFIERMDHEMRQYIIDLIGDKK